MIRRPPRSTPFPDTTLSRSSGLVAWRERPDNRLGPMMVLISVAWFATFLADAKSSIVFTIGTAVAAWDLAALVLLILRSEEHTPELQSRQYIGLRPRLDKKS